MIPLRDDIPSRSAPVLTVLLIAANALAFFFELTYPGGGTVVMADGQRVLLQSGFDEAVWTFGLRPAELLGRAGGLPPPTPFPEPLTVLTSMFLHGGWMHILGNMLFLWIFGDNVEDRMGKIRFLLFYLAAGVAAALGQVLATPDSVVPMVGASGAVSGVMGAYLVLYPRARVLTLVPIYFFARLVEIPAFFFLLFWIVLQILNAPSGGGTAWFAHIGGFLFGVAVALLFFRGGRQTPATRAVPWS